MSSTARLLPVLAGALLLSASSAHATNFAVLFGTSAGDDDQTCNSNLDALHTNSMTFVLNGVSRLSRNTGNDSYSPWDFDEIDDGVVEILAAADLVAAATAEVEVVEVAPEAVEVAADVAPPAETVETAPADPVEP